jgi:anti-anti-sigma factor
VGQISLDMSEPGVAIAELLGEHELYGATALRRRLSALVGEGLSVVVDLTDTTFLDSSIVAVLLEMRKKAWAAGVRYAIVLGDDAAEPVRRMFQITRLDSVLPVVRERAAALPHAS